MHAQPNLMLTAVLLLPFCCSPPGAALPQDEDFNPYAKGEWVRAGGGCNHRPSGWVRASGWARAGAGAGSNHALRACQRTCLGL